MKENFYIKIESMHLPDRGESENVSDATASNIRLFGSDAEL